MNLHSKRLKIKVIYTKKEGGLKVEFVLEMVFPDVWKTFNLVVEVIGVLLANDVGVELMR